MCTRSQQTIAASECTDMWGKRFRSRPLSQRFYGRATIDTPPWNQFGSLRSWLAHTHGSHPSRCCFSIGTLPRRSRTIMPSISMQKRRIASPCFSFAPMRAWRIFSPHTRLCDGLDGLAHLAALTSSGEAAAPSLRPLLRASGEPRESCSDGALPDGLGTHPVSTADQKVPLHGTQAA